MAAAVAEEMAAGRRPSPTLELTEIFELQIVELDELTEIQGGLIVAVIERGKFSRVGSAIGEFYVGLIPILKWEFAFDAFVMSDRDRGDHVSFTVPVVLLIDLNLIGRRQRLRRNFRRERDRKFVLRVGEPRAAAIVHHDVPFVPATLFIFVKNAAGHDESFVFVDAFGVELDRRTIGREVGDLADFFDVDIGANEDALAILADGLHAAGPLKRDFGAAIRAIRDGLRHRRTLEVAGISRSPPARVAFRTSESVDGL